MQFFAFAIVALTSVALQAQQPAANFVDMPLGPGWVQYGGEYATAKLVKQGKLILAQGLVRNGDWNKISEFPTEFRTPKFLLFPSNDHGNSYSLILYSSHPMAGYLLAHGNKGSYGWASLCGIIYGQTQDGVSIQLNADVWKDFSVGGGWETAKYVKEGNLIALMGSLDPARVNYR